MYELTRVQKLINISNGNRQKEFCNSVMLFGKKMSFIDRQKSVKIMCISVKSVNFTPKYGVY